MDGKSSGILSIIKFSVDLGYGITYLVGVVFDGCSPFLLCLGWMVYGFQLHVTLLPRL
jgi:hypothetical protein